MSNRALRWIRSISPEEIPITDVSVVVSPTPSFLLKAIALIVDLRVWREKFVTTSVFLKQKFLRQTLGNISLYR